MRTAWLQSMLERATPSAARPRVFGFCPVSGVALRTIKHASVSSTVHGGGERRLLGMSEHVCEEVKKERAPTGDNARRGSSLKGFSRHAIGNKRAVASLD